MTSFAMHINVVVVSCGQQCCCTKSAACAVVCAMQTTSFEVHSKGKRECVQLFVCMQEGAVDKALPDVRYMLPNLQNY